MAEAANLWQDVSVPPPGETDDHLKASDQLKMHPKASGREAIDALLRQRLRGARREAIVTFAAEAAGTPLDLDINLEAAGIELGLKAATDLD